VESRLPGFSALVAHRELSTPVTNEHFTGHDRGAIYGLRACPERLTPEARTCAQVRTPVPGLYLTGVDTMMVAGIVPGLFSGLLTLNALPDGLSFPAVFKTARLRAAKAA
jgi:phytoene dehydrogenase-like protein